MAELEADLGLRIDSALNAVAQLDRALTQVADDAGELLATDLTKGVQIDASPLGTAIEASVKGADTDVAVGDVDAAVVTTTIDQSVQSADTDVVVANADAGPVTTTIESAVNAADTAVEIPAPDASLITDSIEGAIADADKAVTIEVDTGDAAESLSGVAGASETAGDELANVGQQAVAAAGGIGAAGSAASITSGAVSVLGGNFEGIAAKAGPAGAAVVGVSTALGIFVGKAITSTETTARFTDTFGALAPAILQVDIGGLNLQLSELTAQVGASGVGLKSAAADFGRLAISAGETQREAATTAEQLIALSAASSVLKPSLGSADQVIGGLTNSLARGGRSLAEYGISLTAGEIQARALADTGKSVAGELTQVEKATAGAALATEKYGNTLDDVVEKGSKNASVQLRALKTEAFGAISSLGAPLIGPVLDVLKSAAPAIAGVVKVIGSVLQAITPLLKVVAIAFEVLAPAISLVVPVLQLLAPALQLVAAGLNLILSPLKFVAEGLGWLADKLGAGGDKAATFASSAAAVPPVIGEIGDKAARAKDPIQDLTQTVTDTAKAVEDAQKSIEDSLPGIGAAFGKVAEDGKASMAELRQALLDQFIAESQFFANLKVIVAKGGTDVADAIRAQGPERGAALAEAVAKSTPFLVAQLEFQADQVKTLEHGFAQDWGVAAGGGYIEGILSVVPQMQIATIDAVKKVTASGNAQLGIRSPSQVFAKMGQQVGAGLALGIRSSTPVVVAAIRDLNRFTVGGSSNASVNVTGGTAGPGPVSQVVNVYAAQDPEATAQAVSLRVLQGAQR